MPHHWKSPLPVIVAALVILSGISVSSGLQAQPCRPSSYNLKKAKQHYQKALNAYQYGHTDQAWKFLAIAQNTEDCFADLHLLKAILYEDARMTDSAILSYQRALSIDPECFHNAYYYLALLESSSGQYEKAEEHFARFIAYPDISENLKAKATLARYRNNEALLLKKDAKEFHPINLGSSINTENDEYLPSLSLDGNTFIFTRRYLKDDPAPHLEEDFFFSTKDSAGAWQKAVPFPQPINSSQNEGAINVSPDGRYLFFAGCNREDGWGSCDIYVSIRKGGEWSKPVNLGMPVNSMYWESQPCMSSDGKTLYFTSNRPGGFGGSDIWKSELSANGSWSTPVNLGHNINTPGDENSPFLHPDGKTLYFSSNGHPGMGGFDLFLSRMNDNGDWGTAQNLGYPINTAADETTLSVNSKGDTAYFASDNLNGYGKKDIYSFYLYEQARPITVSFMEGHVSDIKTGKPLPARFELINLQTGIVRIKSYADAQNGKFLVCLPTDETFALNVSCTGYLFHSEHIALDSRYQTEPLHKEIRLHPIEPGAKVVLENIFYATGKYQIKEESMAELDKIYRFLTANPHLRIEIGGHTDDQGSYDFNRHLSLMRAQAVADYLIRRGIDSTRVKAAGYGFDQPVGDNRTQEGRAQNRRTELKIL